MKKLNLSLSVILTLVLAFALSSCKDDETTPDGPTITPPTAVTNVVAGASAEVSFTVASPGGYKSSVLTPTGGTATIKSEPAADAVTGTVVVTFTAGTTAGAGAVGIVVTDSHSKSATSAAVLNITAIGAPVVSAPAAATDAVASQPVDITFSLTSAIGGYKKTVVAATGGTAVIKSEPAANSTGAGSIVVTFTAGTTVGAGSVTITVTDNVGASSTATAITNITAAAIYTEIAANISTNTTWTADKKYLLKGNVFVESGAELTIEPGTVIFGDKVTKGALVVARGAKIHAKGTESSPIVFTSSAPATFRNYGDWGGVVILGKAQNNQATTQKIEGISATSGDNGFYGTNTTIDDASFNAESSGEFYYVRIEFAGIALSTDNELNGLTFGSVGSGTEVHHVQVSYSGDDSFEWFGGTVNTHHLVAYRGWDDEFDTDFGHTGKHQFLVSYRDPNFADKSGSNGFESDNDGNGATDKFPLTAPTFTNVSFFGPFVYAALNTTTGALNNSSVNNNYQHGAHIRRNSAIKVYNTLFVGTGKLDGVLFEKANTAAEFKNNYIARITGTAKGTTVNGNGYDDSNFAADNIIAATLNAVDLSSNFTGLTTVASIDSPFVPLASGSSLATGATDLSAATPLVNVAYRGAFSTDESAVGSSWLKTWTNFSPNTTAY